MGLRQVRLAFFIAQRYLLSRHLPGSINSITLIAILGIGFGAAALIIVLSIFNGLHDFFFNLYANIDPQYKIEATNGRYIQDPHNFIQALKNFSEVEAVSKTIEGRALLRYYDRERIVTIKGVDSHYTQVSGIKNLIYEGQFTFSNPSGQPSVVPGINIAMALNTRLDDWVVPHEIVVISPTAELKTADPEQAIKRLYVYPMGVFHQKQPEYDDKYVYGDYNTFSEFLEAPNKVSTIEIKLKDGVEAVPSKLYTLCNAHNASILNRPEQHATFFAVMKNERQVSYWLLSFMILLAAANIIGSLAMLVVEKKKEIGMLKAMGAGKRFILTIFMLEGAMIGILGGILGCFLGLSIGLLHQKFGIIPLSTGEAFGDEYYPLVLAWSDSIVVLLTALFLAVLSAFYPAKTAMNATIRESLSQ